MKEERNVHYSANTHKRQGKRIRSGVLYIGEILGVKKIF